MVNGVVTGVVNGEVKGEVEAQQSTFAVPKIMLERWMETMPQDIKHFRTSSYRRPSLTAL